MSRIFPRLLLAALAWSLFPGPARAEVLFDSTIGATQAERWGTLIRNRWATWEIRFAVAVPMPRLVVSTVDVTAMPRQEGRTTLGRIELNRSLPASAADRVLLHELAHQFFVACCPSFAAAAPLVGEAFALFASGDAVGRTLLNDRLPSSKGAVDWLRAHPRASGTERPAQNALTRLLSEATLQNSWEKFFAKALLDCAASNPEDVRVKLLECAGHGVMSEVDFLLIDGRSQETVASEGRPNDRYPSGSILKTSLIAAVPDLMEPRVARHAIEWHCPEKPQPDEIWTWQKALVRSCNGFFLDFTPTSDTFQTWEGEFAALGLATPPQTMAGRIGLGGEFRISPREAIRLYAWLARKAPFVIDVLTDTATNGTIAGAADAAWFCERRIAIKTGTVRNAESAPDHAWLIAVGPRGDDGNVSFLAALHGTGRSTKSLLGQFRNRLDRGLTNLERPAAVQILGLLHPGQVALACEAGAPLFVRAASGAWHIEPAGTRVAGDRLTAGTNFACPASALVISFPDTNAAMQQRRYFGTLRVEDLSPKEGASTVPLRSRSKRARTGSRYVLATSEVSYTVSIILSEFPTAHTELVKVLSLVVRNNLHTDRHDGRPVCDTTHCQVYGHDQMESVATRSRVRQAVKALAGVEIATPGKTTEWLPFSLGGSQKWRQTRSAAAIADALSLEQLPTGITPKGDSTVEICASEVRRYRCELVRNQLRLPSCPTAVVANGNQFEFSGTGEGHGFGLDLTAADVAAAEGLDYIALLRRFYPSAEIRPLASEIKW